MIQIGMVFTILKNYHEKGKGKIAKTAHFFTNNLKNKEKGKAFT